MSPDQSGRETTCVADCPGPHADGLCYRDADHKPATPESVEAHVLGGADDGAPTGVAPPGANTGHSSCCIDAREADPWKEWSWHDH